MTSLSSVIRTPIDFLNACVSASVLDISSEKISEDASIVNGTSGPSDCAMPIAMAVLPVLGGPAISTDLPAILPSLTICRIIAAALRAFSWPTSPCDDGRGSRVSGSTPRPRMCEWAAIRFRPRSSLLSAMVVIACFSRQRSAAIALGKTTSLPQPWRRKSDSVSVTTGDRSPGYGSFSLALSACDC